ncbi:MULTISPECIES: hypothetical protein [Methylobacterium]|uniref:Uncharacterized protein n=2 Tax=Methylobacterium TaxID=407 RepID=A0A0C6FL51_9HYPH|nr:hypothetical protein [Methylobacterium aquaticum]BAQ49158.1 hypothetical protein Maq22A_1p34435 [Methylobacterium aquaticum]
MPTPLPSTILSWSRGLASFSPGAVPCRGLRPDEWCETHLLCGEFVERWGMQAHAAGWDTLRLFGIHPELGTIRGDYSAILVTLSVDVHEVTAEWTKLESWTAYRREPVKMPGTIQMWETKR